MKKLIFLCLLALVLFLMTCGKSISPDETAPLFSIYVVDTNGLPVPDLRVGSINHTHGLSGSGTEGTAPMAYPEMQDTVYKVPHPFTNYFIGGVDVVIENMTNVSLGQFEDVCVMLEKGTERIGGFDMLIAYDASVLYFQDANEGDIYTVCDWEYFTYRFGPFGDCGNECPSGMLRVVGMADINNGPYYPDCFGNPPAPPFSLFCMTFYVTSNYLYDCMFFPIWFFWFDCGDNILASKDGDTLWVSKDVYDKGGGPQDPGEEYEWSFGTYSYYEITDMYSGFPTYTGVQVECLVDPDGQGYKLPPMQFINFFNGGIDIVCTDTLDDRGDINLNGVKNEIADAVMFTNYFIYGQGVFTIDRLAQIAATDVNADGLTLSVADLAYLIRIIVGDALPDPPLPLVTANYTIDQGVVSVDADMGAAYVVIQGDVTPELLASQMTMKSAYDAEANVTRVLVYSLEGHGFSGEFLNANGNVISIEMGSYEGAVVKLNKIPAEYALYQNYPNPFNTSTIISFSLPIASESYDYTLTTYSAMGQQVTEFSDKAGAGAVAIEWFPSPLLSGFYRYVLTVVNNEGGSWSDEKWMVLEYGPDPSNTIIGSTYSNGVFATDDTLLFPCLLGAPPPVFRTDETGPVIIGTINDFYKDTVTITLSDPVKPGKFMYFTRALRVGSNSFKLVWDPTQTE